MAHQHPISATISREQRDRLRDEAICHLNPVGDIGIYFANAEYGAAHAAPQQQAEGER